MRTEEALKNKRCCIHNNMSVSIFDVCGKEAIAYYAHQNGMILSYYCKQHAGEYEFPEWLLYIKEGLNHLK